MSTKSNTDKKWSFKLLGNGLGNTEFISKNIYFLLFLAVLATIYIANGHMVDKTIRDISKTEKEIEQLKYEYKTLKGEVMFKTEEAQVLKSAEPLGLKISKDVPQRFSLEKRPVNQ